MRAFDMRVMRDSAPSARMANACGAGVHAAQYARRRAARIVVSDARARYEQRR